MEAIRHATAGIHPFHRASVPKQYGMTWSIANMAITGRTSIDIGSSTIPMEAYCLASDDLSLHPKNSGSLNRLIEAIFKFMETRNFNCTVGINWKIGSFPICVTITYRNGNFNNMRFVKDDGILLTDFQFGRDSDMFHVINLIHGYRCNTFPAKDFFMVNLLA